MMTFRRLTAVAALASLTLVACDDTHPTSNDATSPIGKTTKRTIEEFVAAQGTFCFPNGSGGCLQFVAPIENFFGWGSPAQNRGASFDYAGLADRYIRTASGNTKSLGTSFSGTVTEKTLSDGRAHISVELKTKNALTWVVNSTWNYAGGDLLFGHRAPEVLAGATPSLGDAHLSVDFILPRAGDPLPDLLQLVAFPEPGQELVRITFNGSAKGSLRGAYGVADGTPGRVQVTQVGNFQAGSHSPTWDGFPVEHVNLSTGH